MSFDSFQIDPALLAGVRDMGFEQPTDIQQDAIPWGLEGRDVLACAMTGSGKTAAFGLPILERLLTGPRGKTRALILSPTRELASQIEDHLRQLGTHTHVRVASIYGGVAYEPQETAFREGYEILVATPGRLLDHLRRPYARLDDLEVLVLDEADRMLDMGFIPDVRRILHQVPKDRQTLFFSATLATPIVRLAGDMLRDPVTINLERKSMPAEGVRQATYPVRHELKPALLLHLLSKHRPESALVFCRTRDRADQVGEYLRRAGEKVAVIHGDRTQQHRTKAMDAFKAGRYRVLVATDVAARGIDIEELDVVVNLDVPSAPDDYIHRVGRTARAGSTGDAWTFVAARELADLHLIEKSIGKKLERIRLEDFDYAPSAATMSALTRRPAKVEVPVLDEIDEVPEEGGTEVGAAPAGEPGEGLGERAEPEAGGAGEVAESATPARRRRGRAAVVEEEHEEVAEGATAEGGRAGSDEEEGWESAGRATAAASASAPAGAEDEAEPAGDEGATAGASAGVERRTAGGEPGEDAISAPADEAPPRGAGTARAAGEAEGSIEASATGGRRRRAAAAVTESVSDEVAGAADEAAADEVPADTGEDAADMGGRRRSRGAAGRRDRESGDARETGRAAAAAAAGGAAGAERGEGVAVGAQAGTRGGELADGVTAAGEDRRTAAAEDQAAAGEAPVADRPSRRAARGVAERGDAEERGAAEPADTRGGGRGGRGGRAAKGAAKGAAAKKAAPPAGGARRPWFLAPVGDDELAELLELEAAAAEPVEIEEEDLETEEPARAEPAPASRPAARREPATTPARGAGGGEAREESAGRRRRRGGRRERPAAEGVTGRGTADRGGSDVRAAAGGPSRVEPAAARGEREPADRRGSAPVAAPDDRRAAELAERFAARRQRRAGGAERGAGDRDRAGRAPAAAADAWRPAGESGPGREVDSGPTPGGERRPGHGVEAGPVTEGDRRPSRDRDNRRGAEAGPAGAAARRPGRRPLLLPDEQDAAAPERGRPQPARAGASLAAATPAAERAGSVVDRFARLRSRREGDRLSREITGGADEPFGAQGERDEARGRGRVGRGADERSAGPSSRESGSAAFRGDRSRDESDGESRARCGGASPAAGRGGRETGRRDDEGGRVRRPSGEGSSAAPPGAGAPSGRAAASPRRGADEAPPAAGRASRAAAEEPRARRAAHSEDEPRPGRSSGPRFGAQRAAEVEDAASRGRSAGGRGAAAGAPAGSGWWTGGLAVGDEGTERPTAFLPDQPRPARPARPGREEPADLPSDARPAARAPREPSPSAGGSRRGAGSDEAPPAERRTGRGGERGEAPAGEAAAPALERFAALRARRARRGGDGSEADRD